MRLLLVVLVLGVVGLYAGLSGVWVAHDPGWYESLSKPSWQPPAWVFGVMWPLNFFALAIVGALVSWRTDTRSTLGFLAVFAVSVAFALGWSWAFYVPHMLGLSAVLLATAAVLTWVLLMVSIRAIGSLGWMLVPYAAWMTIATSLAIGYWRLIPSVG